jgi:hypothetical protein
MALDYLAKRAVHRIRALINLDLAGHIDEPLELLGAGGLRLWFAGHR